jgi:hypothetical protein
MYFPPIKISKDTLYAVVHTWDKTVSFVQHCQKGVDGFGYINIWHSISGRALNREDVQARTACREYDGYEAMFVHPDVKDEVPCFGSNNLHGAPAIDVITLMEEEL